LFVLGQSGRGGTETQAKLLIEGLIARGTSVDVILLDDSHGLDGLPAGTRTLGLRTRGGVVAPITMAIAMLRLRRMLRAGDYDVVHSAMARAYALTTAASLGLSSFRRVTWRRNLGIHLGASRLKRAVERFALSHSDVLVANSRDVMDYWVHLAGARAPENIVIPNMVEAWRFATVPSSANRGSAVQVVTVGGLKPGKAHRDLIEAVASRPELRDAVEVVVVGEGAERQRLIDLARERGVTLTLTGELEDTSPALMSADIYAHPSHSEGSSNAVAEAMAAGLPIVATDVGGMRELLGGDAGVLVPAGDCAAMASALSALLNDPARRVTLAGRARSRAQARMSADQVVAMHLDVYGASTCAA
jgi:glycosyltransferase involved in cell wall biosynthesis